MKNKKKKKLKEEYHKIVNNYNIFYIFNYIKKINIKRNFIENIDINIKINKNNIFYNKNTLKNFISLPNEIFFKKINICLLAYENDADIAKSYNYFDYIGMDDIINDYINKKIKVDIFFSTCNAFNILKNIIISKLKNKINIPNYKSGTIINNIDKLIKDTKNKITLYNINNNILYTSIGKINQNIENLLSNFDYIIKYINKNFSINNKNSCINKIYISTTMGPNLLINNNYLIK